MKLKKYVLNVLRKNPEEVIIARFVKFVWSSMITIVHGSITVLVKRILQDSLFSFSC